MNETTYQRELIGRIEKRFPDCFIMPNNPGFIQGLPDILILYENMWAMLEVKMEDSSPQQPNQEYYVAKFDKMSFAAFINPHNEEEILNALQSAFRVARKARVPQP